MKRLFLVPLLALLVLPANAQINYPITFSVDMSYQIEIEAFQPINGDVVSVAGSFNGYGGDALTDDDADNVYEGTFDIAAGSIQYIYHINGTNWESVDTRTYTVEMEATLETVVFNQPGPGSSMIYFVSKDGNDSYSGDSWDMSFLTLQKALSFAASGNEIWVAAGTYYPDEGPGAVDNDRLSFFQMKPGVRIVGGFAGTESEIDDRNQFRNGELNETILSADIDEDGLIDDDNAYHVIFNYADTDSSDNVLDTTAVLNGFTIYGGMGISSSPHGSGQGIYNRYSSPKIINCSFVDNHRGNFTGGAIYNSGAAPYISNCLFLSNEGSRGGAINNYFTGGDTTIVLNSLFIDNMGIRGGAIYNGGDIKIVNSTFSNNLTTYEGGCIDNRVTMTLINSIVWGNPSPHGEVMAITGNTHLLYNNLKSIYSSSGVTDEGNINVDPLYLDPEIGDYRLSDYSGCIGSGINNSSVPVSDYVGNNRPSPFGTMPDIGVYENLLSIPKVSHALEAFTATNQVTSVGLSWDGPVAAGDTIEIYASIDSSSNYDLIGTTQNTYYLDTNLTPFISRYYRIRVVDVSGSHTEFSSIAKGIPYTEGPNYVSGIISNNLEWIQEGNPFVVVGNLMVSENSSLTIQPGGQIEFTEGYGLTVNGELSARGDEVSPIRFTSSSINPAPGAWNNIHFTDISVDASYLPDGSYSRGSIIDHAIIEYGGGGSNGQLLLTKSHPYIANTEIKNSSSLGIKTDQILVTYNSDILKINGCNIHDNNGDGIYLYLYSYSGGKVIIDNCTINNNSGTGIEAQKWNVIQSTQSSPVELTNNKIIRNHGGGVLFRNLPMHLVGNQILENSKTSVGSAIYYNYGYSNTVRVVENTIIEDKQQPNESLIYFNYESSGGSDDVVFDDNNIIIEDSTVFYNAGSFNTDLGNNYWSGHVWPQLGWMVIDWSENTQLGNVNLDPILTSPSLIGPPIPPTDLSIESYDANSVSISWANPNIDDIAGIKVHHRMAAENSQYSITDVGIASSFTLSGLSLGSEYFIAVTAYDNDGNESWYSNEVIATTRVMEVQNLDIAGVEELQHITSHEPLITFDYYDNMSGSQTSYHIQISTDSTFYNVPVWDTGAATSDTTSIQYTGGALLDGVKYYLRAKVASGTFWSEWEDLAFGMNTKPSIPAQISLINDEVTTSDVLLEISNSSDAEEDTLTYDFRLYDATQGFQLDSAIAVVQDPEGTEWEVTSALVDNSQHWWTVQAYDGYEYSELAGPESFLINFENDDPAGFDLTSPLLDESIINQAPLFTWDPAVDPDPLDTVRYVLYLDTPDPGGEIFYPGIDTSFQLDYNLEDNTTYHWKVVAHDLNDSETESNGGYQSFTVNTTNDLPEYFELLYPVWDEMVTNLQPEFLWEASSDPDDETIVMRSRGKGPLADQSGPGNTVDMITGYDFYLSTDSMLTEVVPVEVIGTSYSPTEDLLENHVYYWAVSAVDDSGGVTFSDTASFWTNSVNEAPAEFSLLLPTEGEVLTVLSPTFTWEPSSDPDLYDGFGYHIILGNSPEDMDTLWSGGDTTLTLEWELEDNMTYYWAVFAEDWSDVATYNIGGFQSFIINQGNDSPSMVELITPDSVMVLTLTPEMYWTAAFDVDPGDVVSYEMHWWGEGIEFDSVLTDTNATFVTSELEDNTQYFWEVIAMDQTDGISHSEAATFWTDLVAEAPGTFALLSPEDDVAGLSDMPSFEWAPSDDPDPMDFATYTFQIATDSSFAELVFEINTEVDVALEMTEALPADTEYWWRVVATDTDSLTTESEIFKFTVGYVSVAEAIALPTEYVLDQNYPNPFNPSTTLRYGLPEDSEVSMVIYDIRGNTVRTIESGAQGAGWYEHVWNGMNDEGQPVSTGLYLTRLRAGSYTKTIKMLYLK